MKTNEQLFSEISAQGFITKQQLGLLKRRSNKEQRDLINYNWLGSVGDGYGIPVTEEQGEQGLRWLKKFIKKNGESNVYGYREIDIINNSKPTDFRFQGFYDAGNAFVRHFLPIYEFGGMQYIPMAEPYIIG
ncbi:hypothetical protein [Bacteroides pyogenes]|uniref:hypothetical protein n=1 Tax=Bacteroides pyogenes TaxID=310300 RepID=UPI001BAB8751|nr:hypothetical protein [Bacteroides pyogenes]MBR8706937.1 hypothetical protein [Bacteroides pyogenes]